MLKLQLILILGKLNFFLLIIILAYFKNIININISYHVQQWINIIYLYYLILP